MRGIGICLAGALLLAAPPSLRAQGTDGESLYQRYAPIDLTGTWVSIVTEDWHMRMIVPPPGDFESLPLTQAAQDAANAIDMAAVAAAGRACEAYGAPMIMREPGRVRISWEDADTLLVETDAGQQTRRFHFANAPAPGAPSLQGHSTAEWVYAGGFSPVRAGGGPAEPEGGRLEVDTTNLTAGFLRKNGVPYSAGTEVTEYYNLITEPDGTEWLIITTRIHDPENLVVDYIHSTNFRREPDDSNWNPTACTVQ